MSLALAADVLFFLFVLCFLMMILYSIEVLTS